MLENNSNFAQYLLNELWRAYIEARKGKRKTVDEHKFEINDMMNMLQLRDDILNRSYRPSRSVAFIIHDPVTREIFAASFRDRIVHHFLYHICGEWWDKRLIADSYSCRVGKGTLYGQQRLAKHIRQVSENYTKPVFVAKLDIQGYFMSLKRERLFERIEWGLDRQFAGNKGQLYRTVRFLWKEIIFDDPVRGVIIRGKRSDWNTLPHNKSLFYQPDGQGIVIGNLTSQLLSNIYLDQLDRFVTIKLGYKHYGRYVDDFYIIVTMDEKEQLLRDIVLIEDYLKTLDLTLHPKKRYFQSAEKGVPFIGTVVYPGYTTPTKRVQNRCRQALKRIAEGNGDMETVTSYMGHLMHMNSKKFFSELFDEFGWDFDDTHYKRF